MTIVLDGNAGITTPDVTSSGALNVNASAPDNSLVVNASGNVGVGTSSPNVKFQTNGIIKSGATGTNGELQLARASDGLGVGKVTMTESTQVMNYNNLLGSGIHSWTINSVERARIDSSGNLLVGTTSAGGYRLSVSGVDGIKSESTANQSTSYEGIYQGTGTGYFGYWRYGGLVVGSITSTGTSTAYNTSSDYRLKEDWVPVVNASTRVNALKPVNFAWKSTGTRVDGFLAHELAEVVPEAVTGVKDAVELVDIKDEDGNVTGQEERPVYQGIDQSKLVPLLTAALQEALAKIDDLTARVSALEATNV